MTRVQGGETFLAPLGGPFLAVHITSSADPIPHGFSILLDVLPVSGVIPQRHPALGLLLSIKTLEAEPLQNCHPRLK